MMFKKSRLRLANWLSGGRILFDKEENKAMTAIAGQYASAGIALGNASGLYSIGAQEPNVYINSDITIRITHANGGYIISIQSGPIPKLYLIHEDADFNTELGKIITMSQLQK